MPTLQTGQIASYKDGSTIIRQVVDKLIYLSPQQFPILRRIGGGTPDKPSLKSLHTANGNLTSTKLEWKESALRPHKFVLNGAMTNVQTTIDFTPTTDRVNGVKGLVLLVDDEQMLITVAGLSGTPPTITRGYGGTTAATHSSGATVEVVTRVHEEGTAVDIDPWSQPDMPFNNWQEIAEGFSVSKAEMQMQRYLDDPDGYLGTREMEAFTNCMVALEKGVLIGKRVNGAAGTPSAFGGIDTFIDSSLIFDKAAAALAKSDIDTAVRAIFDATGKAPNALYCSGTGKINLSTLYSAAAVLQVNRDQGDKRAGSPVQFIDTDFGPLEIVVSPFCPTKAMWIVTEDLLGIGPLGSAEFALSELQTDGTYKRYSVDGIYTFQARGAKCHAKIHKFA